MVFQGQDEDWSGLAEKIRRVVETSWWWIVRSIDQPIVIVGRNQEVIRANDAALTFFGPHLIGRPYREAIEGREDESELPRTHPVREALGLDNAGMPPRGILPLQRCDLSRPEVVRRALSSASRWSLPSIGGSPRSSSSTST